LAEDVYKCGDCHTPGFDDDKSRGPEAYAGGMELNDAAGKVVLSPNLTKHEVAGIGRWSRDQFAEAVRVGIRPDGQPLAYPMPHFRGARDVEIDGLLAYLRSFPASPNAVAGRVAAVGKAASTKRPVPAGPRPPDKLFAELGCVVCHGPGAPYEDRLGGASARPTPDVAAWILHPERFRPGTAMPSFAGRLSDAEALALADWVRRRPAGTSGPKKYSMAR
jgi:mono/diheme cytochrome c family protein